MVQSTKPTDVNASSSSVIAVGDKSSPAIQHPSKLQSKSMAKPKNHHTNVDAHTNPTKSATIQQSSASSSSSSSAATSAATMQNGQSVATTTAAAQQQTAQNNTIVETQDKCSKATIEQNGLASSDVGQQQQPSTVNILNGNGTSSNNARRTSKQKWVPLAIDIAKTKSSRYKRRDGDHDDDYYTEVNLNRARRYRPTSYRGGKSSSMGRGGGVGGGGISASSGGRRQISAGGGFSSGGGTGAKVIRRARNHPDYMDYPSEFSLVNKGSAATIPPYMMPYLGTFYYNGVPSYANMDAVTLKDAIKKQM